MSGESVSGFTAAEILSIFTPFSLSLSVHTFGLVSAPVILVGVRTHTAAAVEKRG